MIFRTRTHIYVRIDVIMTDCIVLAHMIDELKNLGLYTLILATQSFMIMSLIRKKNYQKCLEWKINL